MSIGKINCKKDLKGKLNIYYGDGTKNYEELINQPQINDVTLIGNKTSEELGLQDKLESGVNIKTINGLSLLGDGNINIGSAGSSDYETLTNKPQINNVTLFGNKSGNELGLVNSADVITEQEIDEIIFG